MPGPTSPPSGSNGNNHGLGSLSTLPLDDSLLLSTIPMTPTLAVSLTNNAGSSLSDGTPRVLNATVSDSAGTVSEVNFFEGSNLVSAVPLEWRDGGANVE